MMYLFLNYSIRDDLAAVGVSACLRLTGLWLTVVGMYVFFFLPFFSTEGGGGGLNITDKRRPGTRLPDGR